MICIHSLLPPECILIKPDVADKEGLIKELIAALEASGKCKDKELLFKDVMERESLSATGLDNGCAIPHAQSEALEETAIAAAVLEKGIDFQASDGKPAKIVFFIAGPKALAGKHLKLLSRLARILNDGDFRKHLTKADSRDQFLDLIKQREE